MKTRRPGFTLIELLVVISIISLLVAVLLPALASARRSAHMAVSLTNVRQITLAMHMYAGDNKGSLPYSTWNAGSGAFPSWATRLWQSKYVANIGVYWSPARPAFGGADGPAASSNWWGIPGYGANHYGALPYETDTAKPLNIDRPGQNQLSRILLLAEAYRATATGGVMNEGRYDLNAGTGARAAIYTFNGNAVRSYVDGHAAVLDPIDLLWQVTGSSAYAGSWTSVGATDRNGAPYYRRTTATSN